MARTYKDRPSRLLWGDYAQDYIYLENFRYIWRKTTKAKVKRSKNTKWDWCGSTPSWWNNLFHTRPIRRKFRNYTKDVVRCHIECIEEVLEPLDSRKPHKYFW
jgi:hypothetical protein